MQILYPSIGTTANGLALTISMAPISLYHSTGTQLDTARATIRAKPQVVL